MYHYDFLNMACIKYIPGVVSVILPAILLSTTFNANAASCARWSDCNSGLTANPLAASGFSGYRRLLETPHFNFSIDPASPDLPRIDEGRLKTLADQLECSYRYLICEKNLPPPSQTHKVPVYIGDFSGFWGAGGIAGHIRVNDNLLIPGVGDSKLYTVPTHEFFHIVQYAMIWTPDQNISEALAALAEGIISETNYQYAERTRAFHGPWYPGLYGHETFWRYVFEQLNGAPAPGSKADEDFAVERYLPALLEHLVNAGTTPRPDMHQLLSSFIPLNTDANSLQSSLDSMIDNYMTMRYAIGRGQVDAARYPKYYLFRSRAPYQRNSIDIIYSTPTYASMFGVNQSIQLSNTNKIYFSGQPFFGFTQFLSAEYHRLLPDLSRVGLLRFTKTDSDDDIRYQLITRYADGTINQQKLMQNVAQESVWLLRPGDIQDMVLVAYTVNPNPYISGAGRTYSVQVTGKSVFARRYPE